MGAPNAFFKMVEIMNTVQRHQELIQGVDGVASHAPTMSLTASQFLVETGSKFKIKRANYQSFPKSMLPGSHFQIEQFK